MERHQTIPYADTDRDPQNWHDRQNQVMTALDGPFYCNPMKRLLSYNLWHNVINMPTRNQTLFLQLPMKILQSDLMASASFQFLFVRLKRWCPNTKMNYGSVIARPSRLKDATRSPIISTLATNNMKLSLLPATSSRSIRDSSRTSQLSVNQTSIKKSRWTINITELIE